MVSASLALLLKGGRACQFASGHFRMEHGLFVDDLPTKHMGVGQNLLLSILMR